MKNILLPVALLMLIFQSCGIFGIHLSLQNPKNPGKPIKFTEEQIWLGELNKYRSCFDVHYYDLTVEVMPDKKELAGEVLVYATAITNFDTLQLDLHPDLQILEITDFNSGEKLSYTQMYRAILIANHHKQGDEFILKVAYAGKPPKAKKPPWKGGFVWKKDKQKNPWIGVACESEGASVWWPLKDHTSDEPDSMRMHYSVPIGLTAVGNGQLENTETKENKTTFNWFVSYPINTYNVTLYVGKFVKLADEYTGINGKRLQMNHYVLDPNYEKAQQHFQQLHPILNSFETLFGEYPWYNDGFKLVESPYSGMEHQTAIAYGNEYKNTLAGNSDYIILHETAHEWWGNSITASDLAHVWLQEGFATYAEALYLEDVEGSEAYKDHMFLYKLFIKNKYPIVHIEDRRWFHFKKSGDVYMKGAWILHTLRKQINDDKIFMEIIKTFYSRHKYQVVTSRDFTNVVNELTNSNYDWFFKQYLESNFIPELKFDVDKDNRKVTYQWLNTEEDFHKFKIKITINDDDFYITPTNRPQIFDLPTLSGYQMTMEQDMLFIINN